MDFFEFDLVSDFSFAAFFAPFAFEPPAAFFVEPPPQVDLDFFPLPPVGLVGGVPGILFICCGLDFDVTEPVDVIGGILPCGGVCI